MKASALLKQLLVKNAATSAQMNSMSEAETAGLSQSPTQNMFASLMAKKPGATIQTPAPAKPTPALAKTLPAPAPIVKSPTPTALTNPMTGK